MNDLTPKLFHDTYGRGSLREKLNRAIRRELVGGDDVLDAIEKLHRCVTRLRERGLAGQTEAQAALNATRKLSEFMAALIAERYSLASSGK